MKMYFGYAQCNKCKDVEGPWILDNNRFLCERCWEEEKKNLLKKIGSDYIKDHKQKND